MSKREYSILVADDEPAVVRSTIDDLRRLGNQLKIDVHLYAASSGSEVLNHLDERSTDIIFLDYQFQGGMNGDEIMDNITDPFGDILIVLMSAWEQKELEPVISKRHHTFGSRFKFLRKPFDYLEIKARFLEIDSYLKDRAYPFPLAQTMSIMETRSTEQGRLTAMKDVVEAIVKYGFLILMCNLLREGMQRSFKWGINLDVNLTMGAWIKLLHEVLQAFSPNKPALFMPELHRLFLDASGELTDTFNFLYEFKDDLRDPILGHGLTLDEGAYGLLVSKYEKYVLTLYRACHFMTKYPLMLVEKSDFLTEDNADVIQYTLRLLMGSNPVFKRTQWKSKKRLTTSRVYIRRWVEDALPLHPFLVVTTCRACMAERLFLLDKINPRQLEYKDFCNHPHTDSKAREIFKDMLAA